MSSFRFLPIVCILLFNSVVFPDRPEQNNLQVSDRFSAEQLVKDIFLKSKCKNVDNISSFGNEKSVGFFEGAADIIGFSEGILLSSGDIDLAAGPNDSAEATQSFGENSGDPDIDRLADGPVFDAAGIEFDFVPLRNRVSFRYVFASEEYCEFVDSRFNDLFGFFVSGPGIDGPFANGAINVALVPDTDEFVAINSVNHRRNTDYYIKNELEDDTRRCGILYNPAFLDDIEYDGFTIPLTASFDVIPCETYRIRLVVADVSDDKLDSAVFLETKSFDIGDPVTVRAEVEGSSEPVAVETCRDGRFVFERGNLSAAGDAIIVNYTISGSSSAVNGEDFNPIPGTIVIPGGRQTATLPIEIIADQLEEDRESLQLELDYPCDCIDADSSALIISDLKPPVARVPVIEACPGQPFTIRPEISGAAPPYTIAWEDGSSGPVLFASVDQPTTFAFSVTDACGSLGDFSAGVNVQPPPTASLSGMATFCEGVESLLEVQLQGNPPWSLGYRIDGTEAALINDINTTPFHITVTQAGLYELSAFSDASCTGIVSGQATVPASDLQVELNKQDPSCINTQDGSIQLSVFGGSPPYAIEWNQNMDDPEQPSGLTQGVYAVSVTDRQGCRTSGQITLQPRIQRAADCANLLLYAPTAFSPNGDGINDEFRLFPGPDNFIGRVRLLQIFDRWGNLVYEKKEFLPDASATLWNGDFRGRPMSNGVFVWRAEVLLKDGSSKTVSREVLIVR